MRYARPDNVLPTIYGQIGIINYSEDLPPYTEYFDLLPHDDSVPKITNPVLNEFNLLFEYPKICGDKDVKQLPAGVKAQLDMFSRQELPATQIMVLSSGVFNVIRNGLSWLNIERYLCERLIKDGVCGADNPVKTLRTGVSSYISEWLDTELSPFADSVVLSMHYRRPLSPYDAELIAMKFYQASVCARQIEDWLQAIYINNTTNPRVKMSASSISRMYDYYAKTIRDVYNSISENDPLRSKVFMPLYLRSVPNHVDGPDMHTARQYVWSVFLQEDCPQMLQQGWKWPDVPQTWQAGWDVIWCIEFDKALRSFRPVVQQHERQYSILQSWWYEIRDVLPMVCPSELLEMAEDLLWNAPLSGEGMPVKQIVSRAWIQAWQQMCNKAQTIDRNASRQYMQSYIERLLEQSRATQDCPTSTNYPDHFIEYYLHFEDPVIYGDKAVQQLPLDVKEMLDLFLRKRLPDDKVESLASGIFNAMLVNGQVWLGIERYMVEKIVKRGDYFYHDFYDYVKKLVLHVTPYVGEWFLSEVSQFAPSVLQCLCDQQPLPRDIAESIAIKDFQAATCYNCYSIKEWIHTTYTHISDDSVRDICANGVQRIVTQLCDLHNSLYKQDLFQSQSFIPMFARHYPSSSEPSKRAARPGVWCDFLLEDCPQMLQQRWKWPNVPQTWPADWKVIWYQNFLQLLCSLEPKVRQADIPYALQQLWGEHVMEMLPITCPPDLMNAQSKLNLQSRGPAIACMQAPIVYQAWIQAWKQTCDQLCHTPE
jgi:hypothetical protein